MDHGRGLQLDQLRILAGGRTFHEVVAVGAQPEGVVLLGGHRLQFATQPVVLGQKSLDEPAIHRLLRRGDRGLDEDLVEEAQGVVDHRPGTTFT